VLVLRQYPHSLTVAGAGKLAVDVGAQMLVLTHMWEEFGFASYRTRAAELFPGRIEIAFPGLTISW
jgi:ribonuclease BN (tRNA processing enzyme)